VFTRRTTCTKWRAGAVAGGKQLTGYIAISISGKQHLAHRLAFVWMTGRWPKGEVDHINRRRADNRWANLRDVNRSRNNLNRGTTIRGITFENGAYRARLGCDGVTRHLGRFATRKEAEDARRAAERKYVV
jgi:hypothetical protein